MSYSIGYGSRAGSVFGIKAEFLVPYCFAARMFRDLFTGLVVFIYDQIITVAFAVLADA